MAKQPHNLNSLCRDEQFELYIAFLRLSVTEIRATPIWKVWLQLKYDIRHFRFIMEIPISGTNLGGFPPLIAPKWVEVNQTCIGTSFHPNTSFGMRTAHMWCLVWSVRVTAKVVKNNNNKSPLYFTHFPSRPQIGYWGHFWPLTRPQWRNNSFQISSRSGHWCGLQGASKMASPIWKRYGFFNSMHVRASCDTAKKVN